MKDVGIGVSRASKSGSAGCPETRPTLVALLMGLFGLVLLVACGNVAGLLMVRGAGRRQEIAVRFALGASRRRVMQSLLTEGLLLASIGTAAALLLVVWLAPVMSAYGLPGLGGAHVDLQPDLALVAYACPDNAASPPSSAASRRRCVRRKVTSLPIFKKAGHERPPVTCRLRHTFVVAQVAISLFLLVIASLFLRSLLRIASTDPGFDVAHGVVVRVPASSIAPGQQVAVSEQIAGRLEKCGRRAVGELGDAHSARQRFARRAIRRGRGVRIAAHGRTSIALSPGYFETMRIPLLRGRDFHVERPRGSAAGGDCQRELRARVFSRRGSAWKARRHRTRRNSRDCRHREGPCLSQSRWQRGSRCCIARTRRFPTCPRSRGR